MHKDQGRSPESNINLLPKGFEFPRIFRSDCSKAPSNFVCAIVHSSQVISLHCYNTLPIPDHLEILQAGFSVECKFRGNFKAESAVLLPGSKVAAIPDDTIANAISF